MTWCPAGDARLRIKQSCLFCLLCFLFTKDHRNYDTYGWERFSRDKKVNDRGGRVDAVRIGSSAPRKELLEVGALAVVPLSARERRQKHGHRCG